MSAINKTGQHQVLNANLVCYCDFRSSNVSTHSKLNRVINIQIIFIKASDSYG